MNRLLLAAALLLWAATALAQAAPTQPVEPVPTEPTPEPVATPAAGSEPAGEPQPPADSPTDAPADDMDDDMDDMDDMEEDLDALDDLDALAELDALDALEASTSGKTGGFELRSFKGYGASEGRVYTDDRDQGLNDQELLFEAELELDLGLVGGLHLFVRPWFLIDALDTDLLRYEPLEGYIEYRATAWDLLLGQYVESWGIADSFNPIDILNRRDFGTGVIEPAARGELGGRFRYQFEGGSVVGEPTIGLYFIPLWRDTELPTASNRFSFQPTGVTFDADDPDKPDFVDGMFGAARFEHTLDAGIFNADVQYIGARGPDRFPTFSVRPPTTMAPPELRVQYYGAWMAGGGLRAVPNADWWSKLTFKAEVVYKRPYKLDDIPDVLPEDYMQMVFGIDRLFPSLFSAKDQLTLTIEYAQEALADDTASESRPFDSDLVLRLFWEAGDFSRTSVEVRGFVDVTNGELIVEGIAKRQLRFIHEDLSLQVGGRYIRPTTSEPSLFAQFPSNHSVDARLQLDF